MSKPIDIDNVPLSALMHLNRLPWPLKIALWTGVVYWVLFWVSVFGFVNPRLNHQWLSPTAQGRFIHELFRPHPSK